MRTLDVRAHDRRPKVPPPVAQAGRANAGVEREAGARAAAYSAIQLKRTMKKVDFLTKAIECTTPIPLNAR